MFSVNKVTESFIIILWESNGRWFTISLIFHDYLISSQVCEKKSNYPVKNYTESNHELKTGYKSKKFLNKVPQNWQSLRIMRAFKRIQFNDNDISCFQLFLDSQRNKFHTHVWTCDKLLDSSSSLSSCSLTWKEKFNREFPPKLHNFTCNKIFHSTFHSNDFHSISIRTEEHKKSNFCYSSSSFPIRLILTPQNVFHQIDSSKRKAIKMFKDYFYSRLENIKSIKSQSIQ